MAEPLISWYGEKIPKTIALMIQRVMPEFDSALFLNEALDGYEDLSLMERGRHLADCLAGHLPDEYPKAVRIILEAISIETPEIYPGNRISTFLYMPFTEYVSKFGLDHFDESMLAQYELTKLFTAEFSIRPFIEKHEARTLNQLREWTDDPNEHIRRLVSEGTRPRLPWGSRLKRFQKNPKPVIELLELLKDDESLYVRRSVANNLNDIGKDNPDILIATVKRWIKDADENRSWIVRHALRSLIKKGNPDALEILGYASGEDIKLVSSQITPKTVQLGDSVVVSFIIKNSSGKTQSVMIDFRIHYVKANGSARPKVFKLSSKELKAGDETELSKRVSLREMTTRNHYPGEHKVDVILNGRIEKAGAFTLLE